MRRLSMVSLMQRNYDFTLLWTGNAVSEVGSSMSTLVFPLIGYAVTGSAAQAGLATAALFLGQVLVQLPAGALNDRWPRRRVLLMGNLAAGLLFASLAVTAALGAVTLAQLVVVAALSGAVNAFLRPAFSASIRSVVPDEDKPVAYAQLQANGHLAGLIGPPIGGALYSVARGLPFVVDAVSYLAEALATTRIRHSLPAPEPSGKNVRADIAEGLRYALRHPVNRAILLWGGAVNFSMLFVLVGVTLRLVRAGVAPAAIGLVETVAAGAGLAGALIAPAIIRRARTGLTAVLTGLMLALIVLPMVFTTDPLLIGALLAGGTFLVPANNAGISAYLSTVTPDHLQGRVYAAGGLIADGTMPVAPLLAGVLVSQLGAGATLIGAACVAASTLPLLLSRQILSLGRPASWSQPKPVSA